MALLIAFNLGCRNGRERGGIIRVLSLLFPGKEPPVLSFPGMRSHIRTFGAQSQYGILTARCSDTRTMSPPRCKKSSVRGCANTFISLIPLVIFSPPPRHRTWAFLRTPSNTPASPSHPPAAPDHTTLTSVPPSLHIAHKCPCETETHRN